MANYVVSDTNLSSIADAIRAKAGSTAELEFPNEFISVISSLPNVVTGTFKSTSSNTSMDIDLPYSGNGYPIVVVVYPADGVNNSESTFYSSTQRYAYQMVTVIKQNVNTTPDYTISVSSSTSNEKGTYAARYKNSTSNAQTYAQTGGAANFYGDAAARASFSTSNAGPVQMRSSKKMAVFIAGTSYGFQKNIEYRYFVIYSS